MQNLGLYTNFHPLRIFDTFAIPCGSVKWVVSTVIGEEWIMAHLVATLSMVASRLALVVMDLTNSKDCTRMIIGAFVHSFIFTWEGINL